MKHYTPRKKKPCKPCFATRLVRIDPKTIVEAPVSLYNEEVIENYYLRHENSQWPHRILDKPFLMDD